MKIEKLLRGMTAGASLVALMSAGGTIEAGELLASEQLVRGYAADVEKAENFGLCGGCHSVVTGSEGLCARADGGGETICGRI